MRPESYITPPPVWFFILVFFGVGMGFALEGRREDSWAFVILGLGMVAIAVRFAVQGIGIWLRQRRNSGK
jgi:hypothetical protein